MLKGHIFSIISELHGQKRGYKERITEISHALIDALYQDFRGFSVDLETRTFLHQVSRDPVQIERISRIVSFVYSNYPYKLSLSTIAEKENISSYYLSHLFQRLVGDSFRNFVSMVRVEMSEPQLLSTDNSIAQISANVGFSNAKYYIDNFTGWFGCHPKEYRQPLQRRAARASRGSSKEMPFDSINDAIEPYDEDACIYRSFGAGKSCLTGLQASSIFSRKLRCKCEDPRDSTKATTRSRTAWIFSVKCSAIRVQ